MNQKFITAMKKLKACKRLLLQDYSVARSMFFAILVFFCGSLKSFSQTTIRGSIRSSSGEPLSGVSVVVPGTSTGTVSSSTGSYQISSNSGIKSLEFSIVGMKTYIESVRGRTEIDVVLDSAGKELDEVLVIGYGTQKRSVVTSAVVKVKAEDFVKGNVRDAGQLLQGKVAGLTIATPSGNPTSSSQIVLRGTATLNSSTQPLILVDGIPGDLNTVAPDDIESIDVLKDGSAAAIYGTRGTNGVILITTRQANGVIEPSFTYNAYVSTQEFLNLPKMLNAQRYRELKAQGVQFADLGASTDWMKEISRQTPISHNHNFSFRGGNAKTNYLASFGYRDLQGVIQKSDFRIINSRIDVNHSMFDGKLKLNFNLINNDNQTGIDINSQGNQFGIFGQAMYRNPTAPIKNPDGTWNEETSISYYENPLGLLNETYGGFQGQNSRVSANAEWKPINDLRLKALVSRNKANGLSGQAMTKRHITTVRDGLNGIANKFSSQSTDKLLELSADYSKKINDHSFSVLGGYSYQDNIWETSSFRNWDFPAGNFSYLDNIGVGNRAGIGGPFLMNSQKFETNLISFFGRLTYNYKEKYLLMASLRHEASSKFVGTKDPWGTFPAVSAGWRITEEEFMGNQKVFDNLKLRVGYGVTGTAPDNSFLGLSLLGYSGSFLIDGRWVPSLRPISNPNPYLRWEEKKETNVGLDFSMFKSRVTGSIDYYKRTTDGLLYDYSVPTPPNLFGITKANVGIMENKGLEVLVNVNAIKGAKFSWTSTVTFSNNQNKLVSLSNDLYKTTNDFFDAGHTGSPIQTTTHRVQVGKNIGDFYGYKVIGVSNDGKWIYEDKDGKPSPVRTQADKKVIGNGLPKYYAGWNNNFRYGKLDLDITMRGAFDYQVLNFQRMYSENPGFTSYNLLTSAFDKVFGTAVLNKTVPVEYNSYYVEDADFWKIDNITLGYNFGVKNIKHISMARLYVATLNTITFTGYKGMDPEVNRLGLTPGNDERTKYPSTRVYSVGMNITFN